MAYTPAALARRRCTATRKDGQPCGGFALWHDPEQRCANHTRGPKRRGRGKPPPCQCGAYQWPHRPGSGGCRWPEVPAWRCPSPAGVHSWNYARPDTRYGRARRYLTRLYARRPEW